MPTMIREDNIASRIAEDLLGKIVTIQDGRYKTAERKNKRYKKNK